MLELVNKCIFFIFVNSGVESGLNKEKRSNSDFLQASPHHMFFSRIAYMISITKHCIDHKLSRPKC